jgi:hypothetical protein
MRSLTPNRSRLFEGASLQLTAVFESTIEGERHAASSLKTASRWKSGPCTLKPGDAEELTFNAHAVHAEHVSLSRRA